MTTPREALLACPGPCVICGAVNYDMSMGGPTICPSCDCGHFGMNEVQRQRDIIAALRAEIERLTRPTPEPAAGAVERVRRRLQYIREGDKWGGVRPETLNAICDAISQELAAALASVNAPPGWRDERQKQVADWCAAAFGQDQASSIEQRGIRLLEEAIEAYQACGASADMAHKMVDYIFARPAGTIAQELGGVGVTALALANAAGVSADECEAKEVARVLAKPLTHFAARNQAKNDAGFIAAAGKL